MAEPKLSIKLPRYEARKPIPPVADNMVSGLQLPAFAVFAHEVFVRVRQVRDLHAGRVPEETLAAEPQRNGAQVERFGDRASQKEIAVAWRAAFAGRHP